MITADQIRTIMPDAHGQADLFAVPLDQAMARFAITTPARQAAFLAQIAEESQELMRLVENLNYSADALCKEWPQHFDAAFAAQCARNPEAIANRAYAGRMGNGDAASGDGWKYRGRGLIQTTGRNNYRACGEALSLPLTDQPDLLERPDNAAMSAAWFWAMRRCNDFADRADFPGLTRRINGALDGYDRRFSFWETAKQILGA